MGLEEVVKDILAQAKADALSIVKAGNEKAAEMLKKAEAEALIKERRAQEDLERVEESEERKEMSDAALAAKKKMQNVKKELIERAYAGLGEKVSALPGKAREKMLEALLDRCMSEIDNIGTIYVSKKDAKFAGSLVKSKGISVLSGNMIGGIIAESADGKFRADNSFDRSVELIKETRIKELSNILF